MRDYGSSIDAESVKMMPYADAATKEMLRLSGIAAFSPRIALKTFELDGYIIPKVAHSPCCTLYEQLPFVLVTSCMLLLLFMLYAYSLQWRIRRDTCFAAKLLLSATGCSWRK